MLRSLGWKSALGTPYPCSRLIPSRLALAQKLKSNTVSVAFGRARMYSTEVQFASTTKSQNPPQLKTKRPIKKQGRTLVLCFDGTGDEFDEDNSNVIRFFSLLKKGDNDSQLVYYQTGVGTYRKMGQPPPKMTAISTLRDLAFATNLHVHIQAGYRFVMDNYKEGDKICLFGYSRGGYIARALAGMLHKVGLLPSGNKQQIPFAYDKYKNTSKEGRDLSDLYRSTYSIRVDIEFLGVWETVASVGLFSGTELPFTESNTAIKTLRHALALDERRVNFRPRPVQYTDSQEIRDRDKRDADDVKTRELWAVKMRNRTLFHPPTEDGEDMAQASKEQALRQTDVQEVWFAGCHADVGGGCVPNEVKHRLDNIPLRWMVRQCFAANTGIQFEPSRLHEIGLVPELLYEGVVVGGQGHEEPLEITPKQPTSDGPEKTIGALPRSDIASSDNNSHISGRRWEIQYEAKDALSELHDHLDIRGLKPPALFWWFLELCPRKVRVQTEDDQWRRVRKTNLGDPRDAPIIRRGHPLKVHRTVKLRMQNLEYMPKLPVNFDDPEVVTFVD